MPKQTKLNDIEKILAKLEEDLWVFRNAGEIEADLLVKDYCSSYRLEIQSLLKDFSKRVNRMLHQHYQGELTDEGLSQKLDRLLKEYGVT